MSNPSDPDPWSISEPELFRELRRSLRNDKPAVLVTITDVEGSAYRRPGAKMLVPADEESLGAVTAGCLEGPVVDLAVSIRDTGRPQIETFDLMDDDEWGLGLGCNGVIDLLLEPVDNSVEPMLSVLENREPMTVLTSVESTDPAVSIGDRTVVDANGNPTPSSERESLPEVVVDEIVSVTKKFRTEGKSATVEVSSRNGEVRVFVDSIKPAPQLLLFGNQNDVQPVSRLGRTVGFEVVVASARGAMAADEDFPHAHEVVATRPTDLAKLADETTYAVLMSHNFLDDRLALEALLESSEIPYIGLMGPRKRFEQIQDELAKDGATFTEDQLERVSTPVGLDLGGGEPVQIALSIVSETLAIHNGRSGGRLRDEEGPIHDRVSVTIQNS
ncbi:XdhC family protein [Halorubrum sp. Hd13]|uniref:XdhC family protein n=1 Tax=Halorubrum sp. Hd13 TaxID=1480728 RepID=UPI000B9870C4|nr:XdhC/CoxI family protein [Halorubrum sp. Hd13]OYR39114.1 cytochrome oxidase I [Halorubrum sp. Hd13]